MFVLYNIVVEEKFKLYISPVYLYLPLAFCTILLEFLTFNFFANYEIIALVITIIPMSLILTHAHQPFRQAVCDESIKQNFEVKNLRNKLYIISFIQSYIASSFIYLFAA